ncbi:hypothetical protein GYB61_12950 [bacterium]|nr:hypothetical protein [bacterium]
MRLITHLTLLLASTAMLHACGNSDGPSPAAPTTPPVTGVPDSNPLAPRSRYSLNNQCFVLFSNAASGYVTAAGDGYEATAASVADAEPFFLKPTALGNYLLYNSNRQLLTAGSPASNSALDAASDAAVFVVTGVGDDTNYPAMPAFDVEPTPQLVADYRGFTDPNVQTVFFNLAAADTGNILATDENSALITRAASGTPAEQFRFEAVTGCEDFPEASDNTVGETFAGTTDDGRVLGMADAHVHISATTFLGKTQWGSPFHKFGVTHALDDCVEYHGEQGEQDTVGALFSNDMDGHDVTGWPTFPEWPGRDMLTHEAIYWKWLERSWKAGLRVVVNDLVDNETLCELQRNVRSDPTLDCDPMNNAGNQAGSMYAMQDYIDAQYGGRGEGWFQIVHDAAEARSVVETGKMAVILGIEISNLLNCQLNYNPLRQQEPFEETGTGANENSYTCTMAEDGSENSILFQLERLWGLGVRQIISIHEFDNAFGGNGIFDGTVLNLGNRENSGGIPSGTLDNPFGGSAETPTGEFWTTYTCPEEGGMGTDGEPFSGYLWGDSGGAVMTNVGPPPPACQFLGQGGRPGGSTACYPEQPQCNARWMTPIGEYFYEKIMEMGFIFDFDHMEMEMKTQALEMAEAQTIPYPFVSTHGTFGGTSNDQAMRTLRNGGALYPSLGNGPDHIRLMDETLGIYNMAMADVPEEQRPLFGFGFGTDTNGLSAQSPARNADEIAEAGPIVYPYTLFEGAVFDELDDFDNISGVTFNQPATQDPDGNGRTWHLDMDGSAHHGMLSGMVQEMRLHGDAEHMRHLFNAAEAYLQTWERTENSAAEIQANGFIQPAESPLRAAPTP